MGTSDVLIRVMVLAFIGWLASSYRVTHSRIRVQWRRRCIIPLWFLWMTFALGGPVYSGVLSMSDALTTGASFTAGMSVYLLLQALQTRRSR
jgi:hypothetical protein